jgi:hypothetical protein
LSSKQSLRDCIRRSRVRAQEPCGCSRKGYARSRRKAWPENIPKDAYGRLRSKCAISGCGFAEVLEAAHIHPYCVGGEGTNDPSNGLLLRADLHILFDLHYLSIDPRNYTIRFADLLVRTDDYRSLHGRPLRKRTDRRLLSESALIQHYERFLERQKQEKASAKTARV